MPFVLIMFTLLISRSSFLSQGALPRAVCRRIPAQEFYPARCLSLFGLISRPWLMFANFHPPGPCVHEFLPENFVSISRQSHFSSLAVFTRICTMLSVLFWKNFERSGPLGKCECDFHAGTRWNIYTVFLLRTLWVLWGREFHSAANKWSWQE